MKTLIITPVLLFALTIYSMPFNTADQDKVLLEGIDIDQSLLIAEAQLNQGGKRASLGLWAIRDQVITPSQAMRISDLYFRYADSMESRFDIWHLSWAVSNLYRSADQLSASILYYAYQDALQRVEDLHRIANRHVRGEKIYRGDIHILGRLYSRRHLVVPGNDKYLQGVEEYFERKGTDYTDNKQVCCARRFVR